MPELVERVLLGVAAEADAAAHVVELGQVLDPQRVDRAEQDEPLDGRPVGLADLGSSRLEHLVGDLAEVLADRVADAQLQQLVLGRARSPPRPIASSAADEALHAPVVGVVARRGGFDEVLEVLVEEGPDRLGQVLVAEDLVALRVDRLALAVDDVVELDDALADVEVEALDAALGALDRLADDARLDVVVLSSPRRSISPATRSEAKRFIRSSSSDR